SVPAGAVLLVDVRITMNVSERAPNVGIDVNVVLRVKARALVTARPAFLKGPFDNRRAIPPASPIEASLSIPEHAVEKEWISGGRFGDGEAVAADDGAAFGIEEMRLAVVIILVAL